MIAGLKPGRTNGIAQAGVRFLAAGLANTALTFALYQLFLFAMSPRWAYALAWLCGLAFVVIFYPSRVFGKRDATAGRLVRFAASYVGTFLLGLAVLQMLVMANISPRIAIIFVVVTTSAANFALGRIILR